MSDYWATEKEVGHAAVKIFTELYGGTTESLLRKMLLVFLSDLCSIKGSTVIKQGTGHK